jgi:hypothetical protein
MIPRKIARMQWIGWIATKLPMLIEMADDMSSAG